MIGNTEFLKKPSGILKLCELIFGIICLSLAGEYYNRVFFRVNIFFLTTSVTFFIGTFLIVISGLISMVSHDRLRQTLFETIFHLLGFIMLFAASAAVLAENDKVMHAEPIKGLLAAGSLGLMNSILYGISAYDSYQACLNA